jgi:radical SAM protein with 4Fe4S-binding SPASM domain
MYPEVVEEIFNYGLESTKRNNLGYHTNIITNASIMNNEIIRIFNTYSKSCNLTCQLSVDGIKEAQDMNRVTKDNKGTFDIIAKNIPIFKELFSYNPDSLNIHGVLNNQNIQYLYESYKFFRDEWGFKKIWFMPVHSGEWEEKHTSIYDKNIEKIYNDVLDIVIKEKSVQSVRDYAPLDRCLYPNNGSSKTCGAGYNFISIGTDGDIYPCHQFYFADEDNITKIGNVFDGIDDMKRNIFINYDAKDMCGDCECVQCYRCIADNYQNNGSIISQSKGYKCDLSFVERRYQLKLWEELNKMGLINKDNNNYNYIDGNNPNNPDCYCDSRGSDTQSSIDKNTCKDCNKNIDDNDLSHLPEILMMLSKEIRSINNKLDLIIKEVILNK